MHRRARKKSERYPEVIGKIHIHTPTLVPTLPHNTLRQNSCRGKPHTSSHIGPIHIHTPTLVPTLPHTHTYSDIHIHLDRIPTREGQTHHRTNNHTLNRYGTTSPFSTRHQSHTPCRRGDTLAPPQGSLRLTYGTAQRCHRRYHTCSSASWKQYIYHGNTTYILAEQI